MGLVNSSDDFIRITSQLMEEARLTNYCKNFDNILLHAKDMKELCLALKKVLECCCANRMSMNPKNFSSDLLTGHL